MTAARHTVDLSNADVARLTKISPSSIGYYVNDCYDANEDRMKYPSEDAIRKIAIPLGLDPKDGMAARYWLPATDKDDEPVHCVLQIGQTVRLGISGKRIKLTDNLLKRIEIEASLEAGTLPM